MALLSSGLTTYFGIHLDRAREKERLRSQMTTLILDSFSRLNRLAETCAGLSGTLAKAVEDDHYRADAASLRVRVADALHDAWYASRDLDVVLPDVGEATDRLRNNLRTRSDLATMQFERNTYNPGEFKKLEGVRTILDEIGAVVRNVAGIERRGR